MTDLIPIESVNAIELFADDKTLKALLDEIEKEATDFEPDTSTPAGRKEIASRAHKVSRSKVVIDNAGKGLTDDWLNKKRAVDANRKTAREFCDDLRDSIRKPLDEWEAEEAEKVAAAALAAEMDAAHIEALAENELFGRERELERKEAEAREAAEEAFLKAEAEEQDRQQKEREAAIKAEAEEHAKQEAAEAIEREKRLRIRAEEKAKREAIEAARKAEEDKQRAIRETEEKARHEEEERQRVQAEQRAKEEAAAQKKAHRTRVNRAVCQSLINHGINKETAEQLVRLVANYQIPHMAIDYLSEIKEKAA